MARFQREAEVLAALNHPHIAAIGLEKTADFTALVMELVEGDDLSQRIARGAIPIDEALPIAQQMRRGIGSRSRAGDHPSRSQARQHQGARRRHGEGAGLWTRQGALTLAVFAHIVLGVGGMTYTSGYQLRAGYTSYFVSSNQVVFLYAAAWWVFVSLTTRNLFVRIILTVLTLAVMLAMGARSGVVLTVMKSCLYVYKKIFDKSGPAFAAALLLSAGFGVVVLMNFSYFLGLIANAFIKFSSEASQLASNVNTYGALTALVSRRDVLVANAVHAISQYGFRELLIGPDFFNYKTIVGSNQDTQEIRMSEMDPVDLLGG